MTTPAALSAAEARHRLPELTVIDVRTPGEYAGGHLPGAHNVPLDRIPHALPEIRGAAERGGLLVVCAAGPRSEKARALLAAHGIAAAALTGGTAGWSAEGHELHRPQGARRQVWAMERQVRLTAGAVVLLGLLLGLLVHPAFQLLSAGIAAGLVFSALTDTCGMAALLGRLPHNRPRGASSENDTLAALRDG